MQSVQLVSSIRLASEGFFQPPVLEGSGQRMQKVRNRLLVLVVLLAVATVAFRGVANASLFTPSIDGSGSSDPNVNPVTGEPDNPGVKKTGAVRTQEPDGAPAISRMLLLEWTMRAWAAIHLGEIR